MRLTFDAKTMLQGTDANDPALKPLVDSLKMFDGKTWMHLDATKGADNFDGPDATEVKDMDEAAKTLPFAAKLDDQGRLTHLEVTVPAVDDTPAGKWTIDVTGYGAQQAQGRPAGPVKKMPAAGYQMFNGRSS